jgi:hypothetical protein
MMMGCKNLWMEILVGYGGWVFMGIWGWDL